MLPSAGQQPQQDGADQAHRKTSGRPNVLTSISNNQEQQQQQQQQQQEKRPAPLVSQPIGQSHSSSTLKASRSLSMIVGERRTGSPTTNFAGQMMKSPVGPTNHRLLHTQYSMPCSLNAASRRDTKNPYQIHHSVVDEQIINCQLSIAAKKDFNEEFRALVDVRKFVADSFILLDLSEVRIGAIVEKIVDEMIYTKQLGDEVAAEAKSLLFVEQNSLSMLLANTMQGLYKSRADGRLAYDNSWVVATSQLTSLHKRQVAITRFSQPVNFGRQSQEVRFLIIILAPNKDKLTKSAWETGRTFATMFTDINFRRRLLRAKGQEEFKQELLSQAEGLARESEERSQAQVYELEYEQSSQEHRKKTGSILAEFRGLEEEEGARRGQLGSGKNRAVHRRFHSKSSSTASSNSSSRASSTVGCCANLLGSLGSGLADDLRRRSKYYLSDFTDGIFGDRSLYKTISTTVFLYFSVLLPCIAFGVVDTNNTDGQIDPKKTMIGQALGGLFFAFFSGQPLVVIMTTAPLCIYVKVIYLISQDLEVEFSSFYACVGLWMCLFLVLMSVGTLSNLMKYCTRSTEDIFAIFTAFAFGSDGIKEATRSFSKYYWEAECITHGTVLVSRTIPENPFSANHTQAPPPVASGQLLPSRANLTASQAHVQATYTTSPLALDLDDHLKHNAPSDHNQLDLLQHNDLGIAIRCQRETCILFLFLMCGTLWLANSFSSFNKTPYLSSRKREIIKDFALAISVLIFSFVGSYLFSDIRLDVFEFSEFTGLHLANLGLLSPKVIAIGCLLGFGLSVLFYIDQNICGAMVNNAPYKLKKGDYFHLDLLVLAILNCFLSLTGLPWMHGKLPHSHLHSKALADYEERVDEGHVHQTIVNIRETRLTGIFVSLLVALSLMAVPYPLSYIPLPVLSGVFLYTALAEFKSNSMVERICLLFTEQAAYPPNHYIRRCPQRKIHFFTLTQIFQLAIVSFIGFYPNPYVNMAFPLAVATFVPIRDKLLPYLIDTKYLNSLDRASSE